MVRDALLTEKVEQLEALEHQKKEVARLMEEKKIYSQYLQNVMLDAYLKKIKNKYASPLSFLPVFFICFLFLGFLGFLFLFTGQ